MVPKGKDYRIKEARIQLVEEQFLELPQGCRILSLHGGSKDEIIIHLLADMRAKYVTHKCEMLTKGGFTKIPPSRDDAMFVSSFMCDGVMLHVFIKELGK